MYVPDHAALRLRILVLAHAGAAGHFGRRRTEAAIRRYFTWPRLREDVARFVSACLHCHRAGPAGPIPRPLQPTLWATAPHQQIAFDFVWMRTLPPESSHSYTYVFTIVDTFSRFVDLTPCDAATASNAVNALAVYFARFGVVLDWLSDNGSHFTADTMSELQHRLRCRHDYGIQYAPWTMGVCERVNRSFLDVLVTILADNNLDPDDWPWVLPAVQMAINAAPHSALDGLSPFEVHIGRQAPSTITSVILPAHLRTYLDVDAPLTESIAEHVHDLRALLTDHHATVNAHAPRRTSPVPGTTEVDFEVGDFVTAMRVGSDDRDKLRPRRTGPWRVIEAVGDRLYVIQDLVTGDLVQRHAAHLKFFADKDLHVSSRLIDHVAHAARGNVLEGIVAHYIDPVDNLVQLQLKFEGQPLSDEDWAPIQRVFADAPNATRQYIRSIAKTSERRHLLQAIRA